MNTPTPTILRTNLTPDEKTARAVRAGYTDMLVFTKEHATLGTIEEMLPFCSQADAEDWVKKINAKHKRGKLPYRVTLYYVRDLRGLAS